MALEVGTNSYISVENAAIYFADRLYSDAWDSATDDNKAKALIQATKFIDRQMFRGAKVDDDQILQFPRYMPVDYRYWKRSHGHKHGFDVNQGWVEQSSVPQNILDATCEEALALLDRGNSTRLQLQREGVLSARIGNVSETYNGNIATTTNKLKSTEAKELLQPYLGSVMIS